MISQLTLITIISICANGVPAEPNESIKSYGNIEVEKVIKLDPAVQIYCDLKNMHPVIGRNIPVCINGLRAADNPKDNLKLMMFLNNLLLSKQSPPNKILLKNIRRGQHFCLIADIYVDGRNLCDIMVEYNLATKVVEVLQPSYIETENAGGQNETTKHVSTSDKKYVASKSSKVYHWANCPHAKRMDTSKAIYFVNPEDAANSGRRPCKTCKPEE